MRIFVVRRGDSLYSISRRFGVSASSIAKVNELAPLNRLAVGSALVIPENEAPRAEAIVSGYAYPNISDKALNAALPSLTVLCPFSHRVTVHGELTPISDGRLIGAAYEHSVAPLLTVTNIGESEGFEGDTAHIVMTDTAVRDRFVENALSLIREKGLCGLNLNFEYLPCFDKAAYNGLLRVLSERLHAEGYLFTAAVAPKTGDDRQGILYCAHDYAAHGRYCDKVVIMTYDCGHAYGAPRALSPVDRMREVLDYAVTRISPDKILMGFSSGGCNWRLPWKQGEAAQLISSTAAVALSAAAGAEIKYDPAAEAPFFDYTDPSGIKHEVWFEDVRSAKARLSLVSEYGLCGISFRSLAEPNNCDLYVLNSMFNTEKML